ncbi:hypothetical protein MKX03_036574 [Papaver bracteatum]|nr:hypothetical protein MKX03_036574 [Papaver bracteatum]
MENRSHMGRQPLIIIADAELCREVGIKKFRDITNRRIPSPISGFPLHKKGLFFTRDTKWSLMRNTIISMYHPSHLSSLLRTMQCVVETAAQNLPTSEHEDITFSDLSLKLATDVIGQDEFGFYFGLTKEPSLNVSNNVQNDVEVEDFIKKHMIILGLICSILRHPFQQILKRKRAKDKDRGSKDFLSIILNAREAKMGLKNMFTSDYISALAYKHLLAGSTKLTREINSFGGHDLMPTTHDLQHKFPYFDQASDIQIRAHH